VQKSRAIVNIKIKWSLESTGKKDEYIPDRQVHFRGGRLAGGAILGLSPLHREWFRGFDVPYRKDPTPTFYQEYGYRLVPAVLLLLPAAILLLVRRRGE
jgi:hypothetical protein